MRSGLEHFFCFFILNEDNLKQYSLVFSQVPPHWYHHSVSDGLGGGPCIIVKMKNYHYLHQEGREG